MAKPANQSGKPSVTPWPILIALAAIAIVIAGSNIFARNSSTSLGPLLAIYAILAGIPLLIGYMISTAQRERGSVQSTSDRIAKWLAIAIVGAAVLAIVGYIIWSIVAVMSLPR